MMLSKMKCKVMKAEELRVGNLVIDKGEIKPLQSIDSNGNVEFLCYGCSRARYLSIVDEVNSIKLTEEILLKCGFEAESKYDDFKLNGVNIQSCSLICKTLERRGFFLNLGEENEKLNISIDYLHELQNLYYALTKEELDVSGVLK